MNPVAHYWDHGVESVPAMTGAAHLMDARDIPELAAELGFALPLTHVLDVGCGTGRIAKHCTDYLGVDISRDAVEYCTRMGIAARLIDGPADLRVLNVTTPVFDWVTCMSVFTHIPEVERARYLGRFVKLAPRLLVDIIPGDGSGDVPLWTSPVDRFEEMLGAAGYGIGGVTERKSGPNAHLHRYYYARVAA